jgi:fatty acid desaturase
MRASVFTAAVVLDVHHPLRPAWIGAVLLSLLVIGWSISHSIPAVVAACVLLGAALVGRMREGRLQRLRIDAHGDWRWRPSPLAGRSSCVT